MSQFHNYFFIFLVCISQVEYGMETKSITLPELKEFNNNGICGICFEKIDDKSQKTYWITTQTSFCHITCRAWIDDKEEKAIDEITESLDACALNGKTLEARIFCSQKIFRGLVQKRLWPISLKNSKNLENIIENIRSEKSWIQGNGAR